MISVHLRYIAVVRRVQVSRMIVLFNVAIVQIRRAIINIACLFIIAIIIW